MIAQNKIGESFEIAEMVKARVLNDIMQNSRPKAENLMDAGEKKENDKLKKRLNILNRRLIIAKAQVLKDKELISITKSKLLVARTNYDVFQNQIASKYPQLQLAKGISKTINISDAQGLIKRNDEALLKYVLTNKQAYVYVFRKNSKPDIFELRIDSNRLRNSTKSLREMIANEDFGFRKSAQQLYQNTIKPFEHLLKGIKHLTIIPDEELWELPFATLVNGQNRYLVEDFSISYSQSATVLKKTFEIKRKKAKKNLLAFRNPTFANTQ